MVRFLKDRTGISKGTVILMVFAIIIASVLYYRFFVIRKPAEFTVDAPSSFDLETGEDTQMEVTVTSKGGFRAAVSLSISGVPSGVTAKFEPSSVTPPADGRVTSILTFTVPASVATQENLRLTLQASSGGITKEKTIIVRIVNYR